MDGEKYKHTNSPIGCGSGTGDPPYRAMNPHLRVLRALLLEALRNPGFCVVVGGGGPSGDARPSPSLSTSSSPPPSPPSPPGPVGLLLRQDPYLTWLLGIVLRDLGMRQESATYLLASVCVNPLLWMAWQDLETLVNQESQLEELRAILEELEPDFMVEIFLAHAKATLGLAPLSACATLTKSPPPNGAAALGRQPDPSATSPRRMLNTWQVLIQGKFPRSLYLRVQMASYFCHQRKEMERAERVYEEIHSTDPYRMDFIVDYSNVLFMKPDTLTLSSLAQKMYHTDPFRAESNFVVGNYYVLLKRHERGVLHFRRATAIRPHFVAAWTLLGHAYVETKNTNAAIEAYRTVVALDERDYRGWYNLGQIYELLQAYHHALFYYWHATSLRPTDPRMWIAVSECLEHEGRLGESIICLERAEVYEPRNSDVYPNMVLTIGNYYIGRKNFLRACIYLEKLARATKASEDDLRFVLPFLIQYYVVQAQEEVELMIRGCVYEPPVSSTNVSVVLKCTPQQDRPDFSRVRLRVPQSSTGSTSHLNLSSKSHSTGDDEHSGDPRCVRCLSYLSAAGAHIDSFSFLMRELGASMTESESLTGTDPSLFSPEARATVGSKSPSVRKVRHNSETMSLHKTNSPILGTTLHSAASSTESTSPTTVGVHTHALSFLSRMRKEIAAIYALIRQRTPMGITSSVTTRSA
ncbi:unnamed protein product [Phytomonas sp. Hart1]|nr:unnamed protein product [Phytomonas sp. Hart1]|eukprot:CCW70280.1 unnamed protein product [Phytomonas sp. isolate Hart1]